MAVASRGGVEALGQLVLGFRGAGGLVLEYDDRVSVEGLVESGKIVIWKVLLAKRGLAGRCFVVDILN